MDEYVDRLTKILRTNRRLHKGHEELNETMENQDPPFEGSQILSNLFLGNVSDAMYPAALIRHNIVGIINMAGSQLRLIQRMHAGMDMGQWNHVRFDIAWYRAHVHPEFQYLEIDAEDHIKYKISTHFQECHDFIQRVKGNVLVHCVQGLNRSVAVVVAHLVMSGQYTLEDAISAVSSKRKGKLLSNKSFLKQLITEFDPPKVEPVERRKIIFQVGNVVEKNVDQ